MSDGLREHLLGLGFDAVTRPREVTSAEVQSVCDSAPFEGLVSLLGAAIEIGAVRCAPADAARVAEAWMERMAWCVQMDGVLIDVAERLAAAGIDTRVLKGVAIATLDEPHVTWRSYGDVDVLVPRDDLLGAADVLAAGGWRPALPPVSRRWTARHAKSLTLVDGSGAQVDLHRLLATGPLGDRIGATALFGPGDPIEIGGQQVTALGRVHRFLHACYHATLGATRGARHDRDLLLLAATVTPGDLDERWREGWSPTVVAAALQPLTHLLSPDWREWAAQVRPDRDDQRLLDVAAAEFHLQAAAHAAAHGAPWERLHYLAALVWPSREHLAARGLTRRRHVRTLLRRRFGGTR